MKIGKEECKDLSILSGRMNFSLQEKTNEP